MSKFLKSTVLSLIALAFIAPTATFAAFTPGVKVNGNTVTKGETVYINDATSAYPNIFDGKMYPISLAFTCTEGSTAKGSFTYVDGVYGDTKTRSYDVDCDGNGSIDYAKSTSSPTHFPFYVTSAPKIEASLIMKGEQLAIPKNEGQSAGIFYVLPGQVGVSMSCKFRNGTPPITSTISYTVTSGEMVPSIKCKADGSNDTTAVLSDPAALSFILRTCPTGKVPNANAAACVDTPKIISFNNNQAPNPVTGQVDLNWVTSDAAQVMIGVECPPAVISFNTNKGGSLICGKVGGWYQEQNTITGNITITPVGNTSPVAVNFVLTMIKMNGDGSYSELNEKKTLSVTFPADTGNITLSAAGSDIYQTPNLPYGTRVSWDTTKVVSTCTYTSTNSQGGVLDMPLPMSSNTMQFGVGPHKITCPNGNSSIEFSIACPTSGQVFRAGQCVAAGSPNTPVISRVQPGNGSATITFSQETGTTYEAWCGGAYRTNVTSPATVAGLTNGQSYNCAIRGTRGGVLSPMSTIYSVTPLATAGVAVPQDPVITVGTSLTNQARTATVSPVAPGDEVVFKWSVNGSVAGNDASSYFYSFRVDSDSYKEYKLDHATTWTGGVVSKLGLAPGVHRFQIQGCKTKNTEGSYADCSGWSGSTGDIPSATVTISDCPTTSPWNATTKSCGGQLSGTSATAAFADPVLVGTSPIAQFVVGGTTFGIATFKLATAIPGTVANVRELAFRATGTNAIESITAGGVTAMVVNGVATLSIPNPIAVTSAGVDLPVTAKFSGFQYTTTGGPLTDGISPVSIALTRIEGLTGNGVVISKSTSVSSNSMSLVGSKPTVSVAQTSGSALVLGAENKLGEFTVAADANGSIQVRSLALTVVAAGLSNVSYSGLRLANNITATQLETIQGSSVAMSGTNQLLVAFNNAGQYELSAGQSKTFSLYGVVTGTPISGVAPYVASSITSPSAFIWVDRRGGNATKTGIGIFNFPTNSFVTGGGQGGQGSLPITLTTNGTTLNANSSSASSPLSSSALIGWTLPAGIIASACSVSLINSNGGAGSMPLPTQNPSLFGAGPHTITCSNGSVSPLFTVACQNASQIFSNGQCLSSSSAPGSPVVTSVTPGNTSITIAFTQVAGMTYEAFCGGAYRSYVTSPVTLSGLTNGTSYSCSVRATNAQGLVGPQSILYSATPSGTGISLSTPVITVAVVGGTQGRAVTVSPVSPQDKAVFAWSATGSTASTVYKFRVDSDSYKEYALGTSVSVTKGVASELGLAPGVHNFQIQACTDSTYATCGGWSASASVTISSCPTGTWSGVTKMCTTTATTPTVTLRIDSTTVSHNGTYQDADGSGTITWTTTNATNCFLNNTDIGQTNGSYNFYGLTGTNNNYSFYCKNGTVDSTPVAFTIARSATTVSNEASNVTATAGNGFARVAFTGTPSSSAAKGYIARCTANTGGYVESNGQSSPIVVSGLANGTTYSCIVATSVSGVRSAWSTGATVVPQTETAAPITCSSGQMRNPTTNTCVTLPVLSITSNTNGLVKWSASNATYCTISGTSVALNNTSGTSYAPAPYVFACYNGSQDYGSNTSFTTSCDGGKTWNGAACVAPVANDPVINTISFSPSSVQVGGTSQLAYSTSYADSCTLSYTSTNGIAGWNGNFGTNVPNTSTPTMNTAGTVTQTLTCTGNGKTVSRSVTLTITPAPVVSCPGGAAPASQSVVAGPGTVYGNGAGNIFTTDSTLKAVAQFLGARPGSTVNLSISDGGCPSTFGPSVTVNGITTTGYTNPWKAMSVSLGSCISNCSAGGSQTPPATPANATITYGSGSPVSNGGVIPVPVNGTSIPFTWNANGGTSCTLNGGAVNPTGTLSINTGFAGTYTFSCTGMTTFVFTVSAAQSSNIKTINIAGIGTSIKNSITSVNKNILSQGEVFARALSGATKASAQSCVNLQSNMHRGFETSSVSKLQNFLISKGFLSEKASGFFGDLTIEAVKAYQASRGLPQTGMVYDATREAIATETCQ